MKPLVLVVGAIAIAGGLAGCGGKAAPAGAARAEPPSTPATAPASEEPSGPPPDSCCCEFVAEHGDEPFRDEYLPRSTCDGLGECVDASTCDAADDDAPDDGDD